jgi:hypothetical protein
MLTETPAPIVSLHDIERAQKHVVDLREDLRRCMNRVDANRAGGHLLDNTVRDSFRLAQSLRKSEARLQNLKARRAESMNARTLATVPVSEGEASL